MPIDDDTPMTAPSLYRKWRSRGFSDLVGQRHVTQTLRNAVRMGKVGHAYLFTGPRGTGKTSTARILARAVNCLEPRDGEPCNTCTACRSMLDGRCLDLVEIDAASNNSVEDVRDLREKVNFSPGEVSRKVYIIDEVHMLSASAFNALLKTLEEPPSHVLFVLATTDMHKVPATITSRCQRLDFRAIAMADIVDRLRYVCAQEGMDVDDDALEVVAQQATGSLRDALSLLEQVRAYEGLHIGIGEVEEALGLARRETLAALTDCIVSGDLGGGIVMVGALAGAGADMRQYSKQLVQYWRDLMLLRAGGPSALGRAPDETMASQAARLSVGEITTVLKAFLQPDYSGRRSASAQWQLELAVAEACQSFVSDTPAARASQSPSPASGREGASPTTSRDTVSAPAAADEPRRGDARPAAAPPRDAGDRSSPPGPPPMPARTEQVDTTPPRVEPDVVAPSEGASASRPVARDTGDVKRVWDEVRRRLKSKPRLNAVLNGSCVPLEVNADTFSLGFHPQNEWHLGQVEVASNRAAVEAVLSEVLGRAMRLRCVTMNAPAAGDAGKAQTKDPFISEAERQLLAVHVEREPRQG